jgi:hypothetical protein
MRRKDKRKRESLDAGYDHADPSSKAAVSVLSPETVRKRLRNTVLVSNAQKKRMGRLELKLKETIEFYTDEDNVMDVLKGALEHCMTNTEAMRNRILGELIKSVKGYSDYDESCKAENEAYAEALTTTIRNYALTVSGKKGDVCFDSRALRAALSLLLRTRISG